MAHGAVALFRARAPRSIPRLAEISMDGGVLAGSLAMIVLVGTAFALLPAWIAARQDPAVALRGTGRRSTDGGTRLRAAFVATESALAMVLLVGAGLLANSFARLSRVDPGFDPGGAVVMHLSLAHRHGTHDERRALFRSVLERVRAIPGVEAAGLSGGLPFGEVGTAGSVTLREEPAPGAPPFVRWQTTDPGYFPALGVRAPVAGRFLEDGDLGGDHAVVVNEAFARAFWPSQPAVGQEIQVIRDGDEAPWWTVVGVVPDYRQGRLDREASPEVFVPYGLSPLVLADMEIVVRSEVGAEALAPALRAAVWAVDPAQPVAWIATLEERVARSVLAPRFYSQLLTFFAAVALLLASVGVYGTLAHLVASRRREFGVRLSLGATGASLTRRLVARGVGIVGIGATVGVVVAALLSRFLTVFLFGVAPVDLTTYASVAATLLLTGAVAAWVPSRRATRLHPADALRD